MKYFITFFVMTLLATSCTAQITFTSDEFFAGFSNANSNGTSFSSTDLTGLDALIAQSGAGVSWNFGNRIYTQNAASTGTFTVLTYPGGAALADDPDFLASTHVFRTVPSDQTKPTVYIFIKFDQTGYWWLGESQDSMGVTKKLAGYAPPQQQLKFPLTYQTSWQSTSNIHSPALPQGASYTIAVDAMVDAYGTLTTPTSAHKGSSPMASSGDALRVKTKTTTTISISGFNQTSIAYTFEWYTKSAHSASIGADANLKASSVSYSVQGANSVADNYSSPENILNLYLTANPASNTETKLFYTMEKGGNVQVRLMDMLGREVRMLQNAYAQAGQNMIPIDPSKLSAGTYFIRVNTDGMTATRKLIITK